MLLHKVEETLDFGQIVRESFRMRPMLLAALERIDADEL